MSGYTCEHFPCRWPNCACEPDEEEIENKAFYDNMTKKEALSWQKARDADVD